MMGVLLAQDAGLSFNTQVEGLKFLPNSEIPFVIKLTGGRGISEASAQSSTWPLLVSFAVKKYMITG